MADRLTAKLIVTDTAPLITLAAADSLDYLLYLDLPVIIPDGVFYEATIDASKLGATMIREWVLAHADRVHLVPTSIFAAAQTSAEKIKSLGELSSLEAVKDVALAPDERAILLVDDARAYRRMVLPQSELIAVSTGDYLAELERAQLIQSAAAVLDQVRAKGRDPAKLDLFAHMTPEQRAAFDDAMKSARPIGDILAAGEAGSHQPEPFRPDRPAIPNSSKPDPKPE